MSVLVTGGTGFVGGAIVRELVKQGKQVRVLARSTSKTDHLKTMGVEIVYGDILDKSSIESALQSCNTFYHAAALYDLWIPDKKTMLQTAVEGTRNALKAALKKNIEKVIYTSSSLAIGEYINEVGTENTMHRGYFLNTYERAKFEAEQVAMSYLGKGLPIIIVNPASVYGEGDLKPSGRSIIDTLNGRIPILFKGIFSVVYIEDVGKGHVLAGKKGRIGDRYILSERIVTNAEWIGLACQLAGVNIPPSGPLFIARLISVSGEIMSHFTHRPPLLADGLYKLSSHGNQVDGSKAVRELGVEYTPLEEGLRKTIIWFWEHDLLKHKPECLRN